jgi:hypothetical protein
MIRTKESLEELITSNEFIPYVDAAIDDRCKDVRWYIFGDMRYDLLWVVVSNVTTGEQFIECIKSIVHAPPMKERLRGIDEADAGLVETHLDNMWNKYKERLLK